MNIFQGKSLKKIHNNGQIHSQIPKNMTPIPNRPNHPSPNQDLGKKTRTNRP